MSESERVRIEVAFDGGQIMGALVDAVERRCSSSRRSAPRRCGPTGEAALALDAEDGRYTLALQRVVYVKRFARESRVGFGSGCPGLKPRRPGHLLVDGRRSHAGCRAPEGLVRTGPQARRARRSRATAQALEELYLIHFDRIYSYLHMSVGNRHDAEDLTTQTFLKMLESIKRFRWQSAPFSAWLFRIAHNLAMDHFRARRRWQPEEEVPEPEGAEEPSAEASRRCSRSAARAMLELIDGLSTEQQQVLTLKFVFNFAERGRRDDPRQDGGRDQVAAAPRARLAAEADLGTTEQ